MDTIIHYLLQFLLGENCPENVVGNIGYTNKMEEFSNYKIVIMPSGFFDNGIYGTKASIPTLPLQIWEESPILFGCAKDEMHGNTKLIYADIIASSYFLLSRYEEIVNTARDAHGRFPGKESLPYRAGFIDSPLVDEYGKLLRNELRKSGIDIKEPSKTIRKVYLTHDVDQLSHYRNFRGFIGGLLRGLKRPKEGNQAIKSYFKGLRYDPWYTLPWLFRIDNIAKRNLGPERCEAIAFIKVGGGILREDKPVVPNHVQDFQSLINLCKKKQVTFGLHSSYESGIHPEKIADEKKLLTKVTKQTIKYNRHHYLNIRNPLDMEELIQVGITDDFTMGYADVAGFRIGTCRPVKWINPETRELTPLTLHPLTIMDCTLSDKRYMYLNSHDAYEYCIRLIDMVESWNGELVLLWHNTMVEDNPNMYHRALYQKLLTYLKTK